MPGLPEPPPLGATALPPGTFESVTVLITGAGTGLGKAIAVEFARLGASVVIASRKQEHLDAGAAVDATVQHGLMPDRHPGHRPSRGKSGIGVQHRAVLDIAAGADADGLRCRPSQVAPNQTLQFSREE